MRHLERAAKYISTELKVDDEVKKVLLSHLALVRIEAYDEGAEKAAAAYKDGVMSVNVGIPSKLWK